MSKFVKHPIKKYLKSKIYRNLKSRIKPHAKILEVSTDYFTEIEGKATVLDMYEKEKGINLLDELCKLQNNK